MTVAAAAPRKVSVNPRSEALAERLEQGAKALAELAAGLSDQEWMTPLGHDRRTVGVVVHHVGTMYPIEIQLAQQLAAGKAVVGVSWDDVHKINAGHAKEFAGVSRAEAIELLEKNSAAAAAAIRALSGDELDRAAPLSLNDDTPLTCQFMLEDHAVRHSWHHLAGIRKALGK